jgi:GT2 family glycosyltransferase
VKAKVHVLTVTYGDRAHYVRQVAQRLSELGVYKLTIVDNASTPSSKTALRDLASQHSALIELVTLERNLGSAGGFKAGLIHINNHSDCDFIWLLDDDNLPEKNALAVLLNEFGHQGQTCCLISLRKDRLLYKKIFNEKDVKRKFNPTNGFINYSIRHWVVKKFLYSKARFNVVSIPYGPYGGMFFPKSMLQQVGYPLESMYLYRDDHEFSHRMIKAGLKIFLCRESVVKDLEVSWQGKKKYRFLSRFMVLIDGDETRAYYMVRNSVFFEKKYFVTNRFEYAINKALYTATLYFACLLRNKPDRFRLFKKACKDSSTIEVTASDQ